jgi:hypothetical protein
MILLDPVPSYMRLAYQKPVGDALLEVTKCWIDSDDSGSLHIFVSVYELLAFSIWSQLQEQPNPDCIDQVVYSHSAFHTSILSGS